LTNFFEYDKLLSEVEKGQKKVTCLCLKVCGGFSKILKFSEKERRVFYSPLKTKNLKEGGEKNVSVVSINR